MTMEPSKKLVEVSLKRADEALREAGILFKQRELYVSVSRA